MNYIKLWYDALDAEFGIIIASDDRDLCMSRLYQARALDGNKALLALSVLHVDHQLWIIDVNKANAAIAYKAATNET